MNTDSAVCCEDPSFVFSMSDLFVDLCGADSPEPSFWPVKPGCPLTAAG